MKLTETEFIPVITEKGVAELYKYVDSILFKAGRNIPPKDFEDVQQAMVLACLEKLQSFDQTRGIPLGGYLYWCCRGAISTWANKHSREIPFNEPIEEWLNGKKILR